VVELSESFQVGLMAIVECQPIMGSGAEPELRGPGPPVIRALGRGQLASALSRRRRRPHFVVTICQCEPSACFTRGVRLLLIIITLCIGADRIRRYVSAVNGLSL